MKLSFRGKEYSRRLTVGALIAIQEEGIDLEDISSPEQAASLVKNILSISGIATIAYAVFKRDLEHVTKDEFVDELAPEQVADLREQLITELVVFFKVAGRPDISAIMSTIQNVQHELEESLTEIETQSQQASQEAS